MSPHIFGTTRWNHTESGLMHRPTRWPFFSSSHESSARRGYNCVCLARVLSALRMSFSALSCCAIFSWMHTLTGYSSVSGMLTRLIPGHKINHLCAKCRSHLSFNAIFSWVQTHGISVAVAFSHFPSTTYPIVFVVALLAPIYQVCAAHCLAQGKDLETSRYLYYAVQFGEE